MIKSFYQVFFKRGFNFVSIPMNIINDIAKFKITSYDKNERITRCKLASLYRLVHLNNWTSGIYNHISAAIRQQTNKDDSSKQITNFLINPFGLLYSEITATSLIKMDSDCNVIDEGTTKYGINKAGFILHSAIHKARKDINFIIHVHSKPAAAISTLKVGLLPISQEALICGDISYHDYSGIIIDEKSKKQLVDDLGPKNKIMILRNHGVVICGETVEEAWHYLYNFMFACEIQSRISASVFKDQLIIPSEETRRKVIEVTSGDGGGGVNTKQEELKWKIGELEYEAQMRLLDSMGLQTGFPYKMQQQIK